MRKLIWILVLLFLFECTKEKFEPSSEARCRVGRYVYGNVNGSDVSYNITYVENSLTHVDLATNDVLVGGTWSTNNTYKHIYKNDSLYIKDFKFFQEGATLLTALLSEKIQEVITHIPANGATYRFRFDYSKTSQIAVTLEKVAGDVATYDSRAVYYFDANSDIIRMEIFRNEAVHGQDPDNFTYRDKTFARYDEVQNPLKDLVVAHFFKPELPDVTFFSAHNRLEETYGGVTRKFTFEYGTDPMPTKTTTPDGVVLKFDYPNCTN